MIDGAADMDWMDASPIHGGLSVSDMNCLCLG